jgi:hypothetical protein
VTCEIDECGKEIRGNTYTLPNGLMVCWECKVKWDSNEDNFLLPLGYWPDRELHPLDRS